MKEMQCRLKLDAVAKLLVAASTQSKSLSRTEDLPCDWCSNRKLVLNEAKRYYHTNLRTASNLAEYLPKIRTLFYELASLCECESHYLLGRRPKGSDRLRAANPTAHLCAALRSEAVLLAKKIAKPLEFTSHGRRRSITGTRLRILVHIERPDRDRLHLRSPLQEAVRDQFVLPRCSPGRIHSQNLPPTPC